MKNRTIAHAAFRGRSAHGGMRASLPVLADARRARRLRAYVASRQRTIERELGKCLPPTSAPPRVVHAAMRYSVLGGGKPRPFGVSKDKLAVTDLNVQRIMGVQSRGDWGAPKGRGKRLRPLLALGACETLGGSIREILPVSAAIELVHTYSLIHDDLPAMDDDDFRRGQPSNHRVFGEAIAILAGDALLTLAFERIAQGASGELCRRFLLELSSAAGTLGMIGGQVVDALCQDHGFSPLPNGVMPDAKRPVSASWRIGPLPGRGTRAKLLETLHVRKTAALITAAVRCGAIAAGATRTELARLTQFGRAVGLAFQITDDILDVKESSQTLGKTAGKDKEAGKLTYPAMFGVEASREIADRHLETALDSLRGLSKDPWRLEGLALWMVRRVR